jgi:uncharacterized protein YegL
MSIKVTVNLQEPESRVIEIEVEDNMTLRDFMKKLNGSNIIDSTRASYLETKTGILCLPGSKFSEFQEREFNFIYGFPPEPPAVRQLGIFLIDGSGSMKIGRTNKNEEPSKAVEAAVRGVIERLKNSNKRNCFEIAVVAFGDSSILIQQPSPVNSINLAQCFEATEFFNEKQGSDSTNISAGLIEASRLINNFFDDKKDTLPRSASVVILSDGMCHHANETIKIANTLKQMQNVVVNACHLETNISEPAAVSLLKDISSNYETVYDEVSIRSFFIASTLRFPKG